MPSQSKSPYATSFKSAIKRGTPASQAVKAIAKRSNTQPRVVFASLHKAGLCQRQKFNGQWIYWPCEDIKTSATNAKASQLESWQNLIDWCILSGQCKPQQLENNTGSQQDFMSYCRKYFNRQLSPSTTKSKKRSTSKTAKRTTAKARKSSTSRKSSSTSYKFPRTSSTSRRYRTAA